MQNTIKERKQKIRQKIKLHWSALSRDTIERYQKHSILILTAMPIIQEAKQILIYAPEFGKEICFTEQLMDCFPDKIYGFPKIIGKQMQFFQVANYSDLVLGKFDILAPAQESEEIIIEQADLIFIPAQAADQKNNRLGRGGGYYDRFLEQYRFKHKKFCVLPDFACLPEIPAESFDQSIDQLIQVDYSIL